MLSKQDAAQQWHWRVLSSKSCGKTQILKKYTVKSQ
jgi:hypothetical protein